MKGIVRNILILASGLILALLLLFLYSQIQDSSDEEKPFYNEPKLDEVFIAAITGEVFILRGDETLAAQVGQSLLEGDVLKVVDQSYCQLQFAQRGSASLGSNTLLKLQRFLNAEKDQDFHTEVLMGSMLYRVDKGKEDQEFLIEAEGVIYEITGTEFLLSRTGVGTRLSVTEGSVLVRSSEGFWDSLTAQEGEEIYVPMGSEEPLLSREISTEQAKIREDLLGLSEIVIRAEEPVLILLETTPSGGEIYLQGRKIGQGNFEGFFTPGSTLNFRIRKRGYKDTLLDVEVEAGKNHAYKVELNPLPLDETIRQFQANRQPAQSSIRDQYEELLNEKQQELSQLRGQLLKQKDDSQTKEENLNQKLLEKDDEIDRLKNLITQIQDIAGS